MQTIQELPFARLWEQRASQTLEEARIYWDQRADEFNDITRDKDRQERLELIAYLEERGAFGPDHAVLDIGCGAGRFALEFAAANERVLGIDISPRMVEYARANAREAGFGNAEFKVLPWQEADLEGMGLRGAFDLVFASMSAAVDSEASLLKLHAASRGCCFVSGFIHRTDMLQQTLANILLPDLVLPPLEGGIYYAFNVLWQRGIYADCTCKDVEWVNNWEPGYAADLYARQLSAHGADETELRPRLMRELEAMAGNGTVRRQMRAKTAWLFWRADHAD